MGCGCGDLLGVGTVAGRFIGGLGAFGRALLTGVHGLHGSRGGSLATLFDRPILALDVHRPEAGCLDLVVERVGIAPTGVVAAGLLAAAATHVPIEAVGGGGVVVLGGLPVALLAVGWFDPRFAVAATTVWLGAFVTVDAVTSSTGATTSLCMGAAVVVGGQVSWTALRRNFTV